MIKKISDGIWKVPADSNLYFLDFDEKIIIDTGRRANISMIKQFLGKVVDFDKIQKVVFTHLHADHTGNFDLFKNAEFFASEKEIECFKRDPNGTVLDEEVALKLKEIELKPLEKIDGLEIIETPGHTAGSICLWKADEKLLFSGDTIFKAGVGRTDLPTSVPEEMQKSINKLVGYNFRILCPGHDY
ncbi:MAG: MBL fold metallo-hydrolase [bacterium]|nr:MBL fold metallo-hydrolase [bacterium]